MSQICAACPKILPTVLQIWGTKPLPHLPSHPQGCRRVKSSTDLWGVWRSGCYATEITTDDQWLCLGTFESPELATLVQRCNMEVGSATLQAQFCRCGEPTRGQVPRSKFLRRGVGESPDIPTAARPQVRQGGHGEVPLWAPIVRAGEDEVLRYKGCIEEACFDIGGEG
jgi:hypothetical protein